MTGIKLSKLPDRTPVRLAVSISPELSHGLARYQAFYRTTYGREESVGDLSAAIIEAFLESDKAFARWCRDAADRTE